MTWAQVKTWAKARLKEKSTWTGLVLIAGAVAAGPLGFAYADLKDAALVFFAGSGLVAADTGGSGGKDGNSG
jgi:hypothetical protein